MMSKSLKLLFSISHICKILPPLLRNTQRGFAFISSPLKMEHFVRSFVVVVFLVIGHFVCGLKVFTPKLVNLKTVLVHVKVNIYRKYKKSQLCTLCHSTERFLLFIKRNRLCIIVRKCIVAGI